MDHPSGSLVKSDMGGEQLPSEEDVTGGAILVQKHQIALPALI